VINTLYKIGDVILTELYVDQQLTSGKSTVDLFILTNKLFTYASVVTDYSIRTQISQSKIFRVH